MVVSLQWGYGIWRLRSFQKIVDFPLQKCFPGGISVCVWKYRCIGTSQCCALVDLDTFRRVWLRYIFKLLQNRWKTSILAMSSTLVSSHSARWLSIAERAAFPIMSRYVLKVPHPYPTRKTTLEGDLVCSICWFSMFFDALSKDHSSFTEEKLTAKPIFMIQTMPGVGNEWKWTIIIHHD